MSFIYVDIISYFGLSVCFLQLFFLVCSSIFYYSKKKKKWITETVLSFVKKNEIKCARTFEMLTMALGESSMSRTQVQFHSFLNGFKHLNI